MCYKIASSQIGHYFAVKRSEIEVTRPPLNHKLAVIRTLLERYYSIVTEKDDRNKEEEHVAKALRKCDYPPWTIDRVSRTSWRNL